MTRYACERCDAAFESSDARCPKCLRKSSVREASGADATEAERLARGETSWAGSRAIARVVAIAGAIAIGALVMLALAAAHARTPLLIAWAVTAIGLVGAANVAIAGIGRVARGLGSACAMGVWAFVSIELATAMTGQLSTFLTALLALILFVGAIVPVLLWMRRSDADAPPGPGAGKWR